MKDERETRDKLLISAKNEFLEKGYNKASLRSICKNAGVTTGALYFFFKDKEDLFGSLVKEPLERLYFMMESHYKDELNTVSKGVIELNDFSEDFKVTEDVINYIFKYHDEFVLILTKSQGSKYENAIDEFIQITENHFKIIASEMSKYFNTENLDDYAIHWIAHIQIFSFVEIITHGFDREQALKHMNTVVMFLINGWLSMFKQN